MPSSAPLQPASTPRSPGFSDNRPGRAAGRGKPPDPPGSGAAPRAGPAGSPSVPAWASRRRGASDAHGHGRPGHLRHDRSEPAGQPWSAPARAIGCAGMIRRSPVPGGPGDRLVPQPGRRGGTAAKTPAAWVRASRTSLRRPSQWPRAGGPGKRGNTGSQGGKWLPGSEGAAARQQDCSIRRAGPAGQASRSENASPRPIVRARRTGSSARDGLAAVTTASPGVAARRVRAHRSGQPREPGRCGPRPPRSARLRTPGGGVSARRQRVTAPAQRTM